MSLRDLQKSSACTPLPTLFDLDHTSATHITRQPAAQPARHPSGESSITTQFIGVALIRSAPAPSEARRIFNEAKPKRASQKN